MKLELVVPYGDRTALSDGEEGVNVGRVVYELNGVALGRVARRLAHLELVRVAEYLHVGDVLASVGAVAAIFVAARPRRARLVARADLFVARVVLAQLVAEQLCSIANRELFARCSVV